MEPSKKPNSGFNGQGTVFKDHAQKEARPGQGFKASRQNEKLKHERTIIEEGPAGNGLAPERQDLDRCVLLRKVSPASRRRR